MKIGIIVATRRERKPFFEVFGEPTKKNVGTKKFEISLWELEEDKSIYLMLGGLGEIASASSTQYLIDHYQVDKIINYGVVGGLSEEHPERKVGIVDKIIHYDFDISFGSDYKVGEYPDIGLYHIPKEQAISIPQSYAISRFVCASADKIVGGGEPKRKLRRDFGADICEMESAGIVITCNRNGIPCSFIKSVSDGVDGDIEAFEKHLYQAAKNCVELIAKLI